MPCVRLPDGSTQHDPDCEMVNSRVPAMACTAWPCRWVEAEDGSWYAEHNPACQGRPNCSVQGGRPCNLPFSPPGPDED